MILAAVIISLLSVFIGSYTAKRLTGPISGAIKTAEQISEGNYDVRISEVTATREIVALSGAINRLAETLGAQETLRKRLTADVAHELRTPLANLQSHLEAMTDGIWEPDTERLKSCLDEAVRLSRIVNDLDTLARYDGGEVLLNMEDFELSELIRQTAAGFENIFTQKNISLDLEENERIIRADRDKLARVLVNILSNALKYTPEGGRIEIRQTGDKGSVKVSVKDNGIGISAENLSHVFERFFRADKSRSRATGGTGIGLSIAKSLIEAHGGSIKVKSALGSGSEFIIVLPVNNDTE